MYRKKLETKQQKIDSETGLPASFTNKDFNF